MATNTSQQDITQQMQAMIKDIDIMNDELVNSTVETLRDGAEIITDGNDVETYTVTVTKS